MDQCEVHARCLLDGIGHRVQAAVSGGAGGRIMEVDNHPPPARSDGAPSLTPEQFTALTRRIEEVAPLFGKTIAHRDD